LPVLHFVSLATAFVVVSVLLIGCAPKSPEEKVAQLRSRYKARLNGFIVQEEPVEEMSATLEGMPEEMPETPVEAAEGLEEGELGEGEPMAVPVAQKILLDILIQHDSTEKLPGVTVDISMVDPSEQEKAHWRVWIDTSGMAKATPTQFTHILEEVAYEEGDGFSAEIRQPVPAEDRSEYREFASAS
jgi:hypothetical protein